MNSNQLGRVASSLEEGNNRQTEENVRIKKEKEVQTKELKQVRTKSGRTYMKQEQYKNTENKVTAKVQSWDRVRHHQQHRTQEGWENRAVVASGRTDSMNNATRTLWFPAKGMIERSSIQP